MKYILIVTSLLVSLTCEAQFGRVYMNAPRGSAAVAGTYTNTGSNTWWDETISSDQLSSRTNNVNLNYTHVVRIFDRTGGIGLNLPITNILSYNTTNNQVVTRTAGLSDPSIVFDVNIFGGASMVPEVFKKTPMRDYFGIHTLWGLPLGKYDPNAASNIGGNRFTSRILFNYGVPFKAGKNWLDLYASVKFFGKNDEFRGDNQFTQKPLFGLEAHYTHDVAKKTWIGGGLIYGVGGKQLVNDVLAAQSQNSLKYSLAVSFPAWAGASTFLSYNQTIFRPEGTPITKSFILQFLHFAQFKNVKPYKKDPQF